MNAGFLALIQRRRYRDIAISILALERDRGVFDLQALVDDPEGELEGNSELQIEYDLSPKAGCSVFGYYRFQRHAPSLIVVHPSMTSARDRFTILHEFGHHVQRQHLPWAQLRYAVQGAAGTKLEERVADAIAAELLLPSDLAIAGLDARQLSDVHGRSRASRSAVAMRAIEVAPDTDSFLVMVLERDGSVLFSRAAGDEVFAPAKGVPQPDFAGLIDAAIAAGGAFSGPLPDGLRAASGWIQGDLNADLAADYSGMYFFAVVRPAQKFGRVPEWTIEEAECTSPACELVFAVGPDVERCPNCEGPRCPNCNSCFCERPVGAICQRCFTALSLAEQSGQLEHECL